MGLSSRGIVPQDGGRFGDAKSPPDCAACGLVATRGVVGLVGGLVMIVALEGVGIAAGLIMPVAGVVPDPGL